MRVAAETLSRCQHRRLDRDDRRPAGRDHLRARRVRALAVGELTRNKKISAADVVGLDTVWASPTDSTFDVARLMRDAEVRHVPKSSGEECVGMVSIRDVLRILIGS